jgi:SAM-dependent methyltransferase
VISAPGGAPRYGDVSIGDVPTVARYDGLADWYDSFVRAAGLTAIELEAMTRLLGPGPGRCLDLGCGTGVSIEPLTDAGWSVVGLDVSSDQLRVARERTGHLAVSLIQGDAAALPFADASFDAVVSLLTHTDFDDFARVAAEVARVLVPGGRLVYVGPHPCFLAPTVERRADEPHLLHEGYRRRGWWHDAPGFRLGREGVRGRAGVNHLTLADFLNAIVVSGLRLQRVEEPGDEDYPVLLALAARR